jgi:hypothetical protein
VLTALLLLSGTAQSTVLCLGPGSHCHFETIVGASSRVVVRNPVVVGIGDVELAVAIELHIRSTRQSMLRGCRIRTGVMHAGDTTVANLKNPDFSALSEFLVRAGSG